MYWQVGKSGLLELGEDSFCKNMDVREGNKHLLSTIICYTL